MKKVTVSLVVVVIIFLVVLRLIDPRFDDIQELRDKGWIPLWAPEPKKLVSHSRDLNLNTSETVMFYEESEIEKLLVYLTQRGEMVPSSYSPKLLGGFSGHFFWADGYLIIIDESKMVVTFLSSWREAGESRWNHPSKK